MITIRLRAQDVAQVLAHVYRVELSSLGPRDLDRRIPAFKVACAPVRLLKPFVGLLDF
jgi:hypothetical protein